MASLTVRLALASSLAAALVGCSTDASKSDARSDATTADAAAPAEATADGLGLGYNVPYDKQPQCLPASKLAANATLHPVLKTIPSHSASARELALVTNFRGVFAVAPDIAIKQKGFGIGVNALNAGFFRDLSGCKIANIANMTDTAYDVIIARQICQANGYRTATLGDLLYQDYSLVAGFKNDPSHIDVQSVLFNNGGGPQLFNFVTQSTLKVNTSTLKGNNCKAVAGSLGGCVDNPNYNYGAVVCAR